YEQAVEVVLGQQRGSATLLQRALAVGYTRATRLLELMEADGLVGAYNGSKSRDVLLTLEEWQAQEAAAAEELAALDAGGVDDAVDADDDDADADMDEAGADAAEEEEPDEEAEEEPEEEAGDGDDEAE